MTVDHRPPPTTDHDGGDIGFRDLVYGIYAFFYNKRVGLLIILVMAILTLVGVLFPQAPDDVRADPAAMASWIDQWRPRYRGLTDALAFLGVFTVFSSIVFIAVTILLALSIAACTTHRVPLLWAQATKPHVGVKDSFFEHARYRATAEIAAPVEVARERVREALASQRMRVLDAPGGFYADRNRFAPFGTAIAHVAFVVILAGVLISSVAGFRIDTFAAPVGEKVEVGYGTNLTVEARGFSDTYNPDGSPADYAADLVLYENGHQVAQQIVRVNSPLRWGGVSFNQSYFGIAADVTITDASGAVLHAGGVPLEYTTKDGVNTFGKVSLPAQKSVLYVITAASGQNDPNIAPGQARIEVFAEGSDETKAAAVIDQGKATKVGDLTVTFERERQFTGLMVSRDPGAPWVWVGSLLLVLGTCWTMFLRHHRLWVRVTDADGGSLVTLASPDRHDATFESRMNHFAAQLATTKEPDHA